MAREKSDILSGAGSTYEIIRMIINEVKNRGGSDDDVRKILSDRALQIRIGDLIMESEQPTIYPVEIDYSDTFQQRIDAGCYNQKDPAITEKHFPIKGQGKIRVNLQLLYYGQPLSNDVVRAVVRTHGYRPATIEEVLAFGSTYPELQREFPIVALGSVWQDGYYGHYSHHAVYLYKHGYERHLCLGRLETGWRGHYRFLVVHK